MSVNITRRSFLVKLTTFTAGAVALAACGGGAAAPTAAPAKPAGGGEVTLDIGSKGDELLYDKASLEAPAGSKITLRLKNNATVASTLHNWVLAASASAADGIAADGITAGEAAGYIKAGDNRVIAKTKMIKGGETDSVTFDAPKAGTYTYVCTFPGHAALMRGTLTIK